jgi:hypothetical protein
MNNAVFGKTMESLRENLGETIRPRKCREKIANPLYDGHIIYNDSLTAIKKRKKTIILNKPIYCGMAILDLSKLHMYRFHYDYINTNTGTMPNY